MSHEQESEFDDSGTFPVMKSRRSPGKDQVREFLSWATRGILVALCLLAVHDAQQIQSGVEDTKTTLNDLQVKIAKISTTQDNQGKQLDQHSEQIQRLWQKRDQ